MHPHGPTDTYQPSPGSATCPHCAHVVAGVAVPTAAQFATFAFDCPSCGRHWKEIRDRGDDHVGRYYARAGAGGAARLTG